MLPWLILCYFASLVNSNEFFNDLRMFRKFIIEFNKSYSSAEEFGERFEIFRQKLEFVNTHNSKGLPWTVEINRFADWTREE
jgi:hypothetical protein